MNYLLLTVVHLALVGIVRTWTPGLRLLLRPPYERIFRTPRSYCMVTCAVSGAAGNKYEIRWYSPNGTEITDTAGSLRVETGSQSAKTLYVLQLTDQDAGNYSCSANISGHLQQKNFELVIYEDITMIVSPGPLTVTFNTEVLIPCTASARPKPVILWKLGEQPIESGGQYDLVVGQGLQIRNASGTDSGNYICRAEVHDPDGRLRYMERATILEVHSPPTIKNFKIDDLAKSEGSRLTTFCEAVGLPTPTFQFYKDGNTTPLKSTNRILISDFPGLMIFTSVQKSDEGSYTCMASNSFGSDTRTGSLRIYPDVAIASNPTRRPEEHVNECLVDNGGCEQLCIDTVYSRQCDCQTGKLQGNGETCTANTNSPVFIIFACVAVFVFLAVLVRICIKSSNSSRSERTASMDKAGAHTYVGGDETASLAYHRDQPMSLDEVPADDRAPAPNPYYSSDQGTEVTDGCVILSAPPPPELAPPSYVDLYGTEDCTAAAAAAAADGDDDCGDCGGVGDDGGTCIGCDAD